MDNGDIRCNNLQIVVDVLKGFIPGWHLRPLWLLCSRRGGERGAARVDEWDSFLRNPHGFSHVRTNIGSNVNLPINEVDGGSTDRSSMRAIYFVESAEFCICGVLCSRYLLVLRWITVEQDLSTCTQNRNSTRICGNHTCYSHSRLCMLDKTQTSDSEQDCEAQNAGDTHQPVF